MRVRNIRDFLLTCFTCICVWNSCANETERKSARVKDTDEADVQGV